MISVIIPLFNKAKTVARSIESVLRQTYSDFNIVIVDDGSSDGSVEIVKEFSDSRITIVKQENAGPGAARNSGVKKALELSPESLLAFLDADDEWLPSYLEHQVKIFAQNDSTLAASVCGYVEIVDGDTEPRQTSIYWSKRKIPDEKISYRAENYSPSELIALLAYMSPWSTVVRADIFAKYRGFYENKCRYAEDSYLWLQILLQENVYFSLNPLVIYHRESSELTRSDRMRPIEPFVEDFEKYVSLFSVDRQPLASETVALRGLKTACVLGCYGEVRRGKELVRKFSALAPSGNLLRVAALIANTPIGPSARKLLAAVRRYIG